MHSRPVASWNVFLFFLGLVVSCVAEQVASSTRTHVFARLAGAPMPLLAFVQRLWLACLVSAAVTLVGLLALTWTTLNLAYVSQRPEPLGRRTWLGVLGLVILVAGYLLSDSVGVPLGIVACGGAVLLLVLDAYPCRSSRWTWRRRSLELARAAGGLTIVVEGLCARVSARPRAGLETVALRLAGHGGGRWDGLLRIINNLPMALVTAAALHQLDFSVISDWRRRDREPRPWPESDHRRLVCNDALVDAVASAGSGSRPVVRRVGLLTPPALLAIVALGITAG
jgi:hypothetical protein